MEQATKKKALIVGSVIVIGGILVYIFREQLKVALFGDKGGGIPKKSSEDVLAFQKWANKKHSLGLNEDGVADDATSKAYDKYKSEMQSDQQSGSGASSGHIKVTAKNISTKSGSPLSNPDDIRNFQVFANSKGANLAVDGKYGPKTAAAWTKYGAQYQNSTTPRDYSSTLTKGDRVKAGSSVVNLYSSTAMSNATKVGTVYKGASLGILMNKSLLGGYASQIYVNASNTTAVAEGNYYVPTSDLVKA